LMLLGGHYFHAVAALGSMVAAPSPPAGCVMTDRHSGAMRCLSTFGQQAFVDVTWWWRESGVRQVTQPAAEPAAWRACGRVAAADAAFSFFSFFNVSGHGAGGGSRWVRAARCSAGMAWRYPGDAYNLGVVSRCGRGAEGRSSARRFSGGADGIWPPASLPTTWTLPSR